MAAKAGEPARESGVYRCMTCNNQIRLSEGYMIPDCPSCGHESYETSFARGARRREPAEARLSK